MRPCAGIGGIDADDDLGEVADLAELVEDPAQGRRAELIRMAGQDERDRARGGKRLELAFETRGIARTEPVQGRHRAILKKVRHRAARVRQPGGLFNIKRHGSVRSAMPDGLPRELVVIHYHFRAGGVRRVIERLLPELAGHFENVTLLAGEAPEPAWAEALLKKIPGAKFAIHPALGYLAGSFGPDLLRREIRRALQLHIGADSLVWAHNLALGRNILLADEVAALSAATGARLLSHHHDFWCDHRWARWPEMRACGFRSLEQVARAVFAAGARAVHAGINSADVRHLAKSLPGTAWLPNPMDGAVRPTDARVRAAKNWLSHQLGDGAPAWVFPARFLRRKNFAEAALLTGWLCPGGWLVSTGGVSSDGEAGYARRLVEAAGRGMWRAQFGVLSQAGAPSVFELMAAADALVMTSVQEGFGFPYLEGAGLGRPLVARCLPQIQPDLDALGLRLPGLYDEVMIPCGLFDAAAETRRQEDLVRRWRGALPQPVRHLAGTPHFLEFPDSPVPFSRLTLSAQLDVLAVPPAESRDACFRENPSLAGLAAQPPPEPPPGSFLSPAECAARLLALPFPKSPATPNQTHRAQSAILRERLASRFLFPILME